MICNKVIWIFYLSLCLIYFTNAKSIESSEIDYFRKVIDGLNPNSLEIFENKSMF